MKAFRSHQQQWVVTVTRKHNPPRKITVFGRSPAEAIQGAVASALHHCEPLQMYGATAVLMTGMC